MSPNWLWAKGLQANSPAAYIFAAACVGIATLVRGFLGVISPDIIPFSTYYPAVLLATLVGRASSGVLAMVLGGIIGFWAFLPPYYVIKFPTIAQAISCTIYALSAGLVVCVAEGYRRATHRLEDAEVKLALVASELQHRLRNSLTVVQAIVSQTLRRNPEDAEKIYGRIRALAQTNDLLSQSTHQQADLKSILQAELRPYGETRITIQAESLQLPAAFATALALIFHELATNAAKYGALSTPEGRLLVSWKSASGRVQIRWVEYGGPAVVPPSSVGFGTQLIKRLVESIQGSLEHEFHPDGIVCNISFPMPAAEPGLVQPPRIPSQSPVSLS